MNCRESVFFVASGNPKDGVAEPSIFVNSQVDSVQQAGWKVFLSIVDDRTSIRGVLRNLRRIRQEVDREKPGLVHAQYGSITAAVAYCAKGRVPLIVSFGGDDLLGTPNPGLLWRLREKGARAIGLAAACGVAVVLVKSPNLLDALPIHLRRKAVVLPNGVDVNWFKPMDKFEARARLGWSQEAKIVLFNASNSGNQNVKNVPLARASVDILSRSIPDAILQQMSGANPEEVLWMLNAADCLLVASLHEGSPNIVKEAMACNLPVVSVACGDVAERLKGTYPGRICLYDARSLAEAIEDVFRAGCRSNGREQLMAQGLSAAAVAERLIRVYASVQQGHSIPMELHKTACVE
jgi:glycosyltransferase involved in cell wall biosynthesis